MIPARFRTLVPARIRTLVPARIRVMIPARIRVMIPVVAGCGLTIAVLAQQSSPKPPQPAKSESREVVITGHPIAHSDATGMGRAENMELVDGETVILGDVVAWNDKKKSAEASGHLNMTDPEADGTCDKANIYYGKSKKLLVLTGNVRILLKPKAEKGSSPTTAGPAQVDLKDGKATVRSDQNQEDDSPRKHPAVVTCDRVEYQYARDKKHALLTGSFKAVQTLTDKTRTLTADHAEWFGREEKLVLHPPVHFEDTKGNHGDPKGVVVVYTKEGDERIEMKEGGIIHLRVEDDGDESKQPSESKLPSESKPPVKPPVKPDSKPGGKPPSVASR